MQSRAPIADKVVRKLFIEASDILHTHKYSQADACERVCMITQINTRTPTHTAADDHKLGQRSLSHLVLCVNQ